MCSALWQDNKLHFDVATAIAWVHGHIVEYGGDPEQLYLMGHCAGSHLVALVGADETYLAAHGLTLGDISAVVPLPLLRFGSATPGAARPPMSSPRKHRHWRPVHFALRGGSWVGSAASCHCACRDDDPPAEPLYYDRGFRVAGTMTEL